MGFEVDVNINKSLTDRIEQIKQNCSPLGVKVQLTRRKDRYYVKFSADGQVETWVTMWGGFYKFCKHQINPHFPNATTTLVKQANVQFFVGCLFDFLKNEVSR